MLKKCMREPLVHFFLLGALIFGVFSITSERETVEPNAITITAGQITAMAVGFERVWQRPPSAAELETLIQDQVREEVLYREALALELDRDDPIVRRRMQQKMQFLTEDLSALAEPTEAELRAHLQSRPQAFATERRHDFRQIYLNPARHGDTFADVVAALRARLEDGSAPVDASALGDPVLLAHEFVAATDSEIAASFGDEFALRLGELPIGQWQGPIASGVGAHFVLINGRIPPRAPSFEAARRAVREDLLARNREAANAAVYQEIIARYSVKIERPQSAPVVPAESGK